MKASLKWLNEWVDLSDIKNPQEIADILTARGLEVEGMHRQDEGFDKVITAQIVHKEKHPEADRLSLCKVNPGTGEYLDIVCGAQNMKMGDIVALAQVGAHLPNGLKIEKSKIRGAVSMGMLCSESELGLAATSEGIIVFPEKTPVGWKVADVLAREDVIFEIKLTANRGDCLSHRGLARELAAALGKPLKTPKVTKLDFSGTGSPFKIQLNAGEDAPQFYGCYIQGIKVGDSPGWLKNRLEAIGQRSINNIVDVSNFLMFEYGFPVHIYDSEKLEGGVIKVERSQKGQKLKLLDDSEIECSGEELVIMDGAKAVGLAGVMGGGNSEVSEDTKHVFLECAEFNPTLVRRAAFKFQKRSEASLRFEKGIDPAGLPEALCRLADLVCKLGGGIISGSACARVENSSSSPRGQKIVITSAAEVNQFLGTSIDELKIIQILESLECKVEKLTASVIKGANLKITAPSYRLDLSIPQDIAEEVARCIGYDAIPVTIPALTGMPKSQLGDTQLHRLNVIDTLKNSLADQGLSEVLNYSFQSESWLKKFGFKSTVKILNPISEDQGFMVPSLLPGMMKAYQENERHHFGSEPLAVRIFEVRPVFHFSGTAGGANAEIKALSETDTGVTETWKVSMLISGPRFDQALKSERGEVDFYDLKSVVESCFESLGTKGIRYRISPADSGGVAASQGAVALYHPGQALEVSAGKEVIGMFGRIHPQLESELKLRTPVYWAEINLESVFNLTPQVNKQFKAWSDFPTMERDFALLVKEEVLAENLIQSALKHGKPIAKVVKIFDTYKGAHIPEGMISIGVRVIFSDEAKSLEEKQVDQCAELIVKKWTEEFKAQLR